MSEFMTLEEAEHYLDLARMVRYTKEARALADKGDFSITVAHFLMAVCH